MAGGIWPPAPISDRIHASYCQTSTQICPLAICGGLGVAVGRFWAVRSGGGHAPGPSVPRAVRHTPPAPALNRASLACLLFNFSTVNGDSNAWPPLRRAQKRKSNYCQASTERPGPLHTGPPRALCQQHFDHLPMTLRFLLAR